jgi:tetratricopeptide (TPR) repeat protein
METLRNAITGILLMLTTGTCLAQQESTLQKAFSDSYAAEANKKYGDAIGILERNCDEKGYECNLRLGWLHYLNRNFLQSQQYYQKAASLKPYAVEAKLGLIKPLSALESWDKVLQTYEEILKVDPQNQSANYWAGVIHYNRKKYEQAARYFEKTVNLYPFDYDGNHMLAWTYLNLGRSQEARILFNKAMLNRPGDASCKDGLSRIR